MLKDFLIFWYLIRLIKKQKREFGKHLCLIGEVKSLPSSKIAKPAAFHTYLVCQRHYVCPHVHQTGLKTVRCVKDHLHSMEVGKKLLSVWGKGRDFTQLNFFYAIYRNKRAWCIGKEPTHH